jgi:hypothetical protein
LFRHFAQLKTGRDLTNSFFCGKTRKIHRERRNSLKNNDTMMQYFEWYLPNDGLWWKRCAAKADNLAALGITQV